MLLWAKAKGLVAVNIQRGGAELHEAIGSEWLSKGKCPIAKSYQAVGGMLPLVAKWLKPPPGMKVKCPPAIVAARAALARTALAKSLRPQPLPSKVLAIGLLGMAVNVPLGVWREHTKKFSPSWFVAVHASVPFVAMLRKAVHMPQYAMAFTIASAILGQFIGSRAERYRLLSGTTHVVEESEALSGSDLPKAIYMKKNPSTEADIQHDKRQSASLAYQCAKQIWDATSASKSVSAPVGAF
ncbi:hypothetical protein O6H91_23G028900 [Diphasiastrum complanatum]|uniref:Uncharacterized protein n=1 Tax=Diphasiastrum complanatum TaxID=34168 RepID=A0ACC2A9A1_DIPCM|nr:hypothetical protein O6H91_23G028900 [Diphasiastrum complanatum]